jgi:hypothetical protein
LNTYEYSTKFDTIYFQRILVEENEVPSFERLEENGIFS